MVWSCRELLIAPELEALTTMKLVALCRRVRTEELNEIEGLYK